MRDETSYQLLIVVTTPLHCAVGRLGSFHFPPGRYVYTGSAKRNLEARIARHLRPDKALRWHIDYLLTSPGVRVVEAVRSRRSECDLNRAVRGRIVCVGFGASDCRAGCGAHLKYLGGFGAAKRNPRADVPGAQLDVPVETVPFCSLSTLVVPGPIHDVHH